MFFDFNKKVYKKDSWSELKKIELNDLGSCIQLESDMLNRMQNKEYACSYIRKREKDEFEKIIKNGELYGIYDLNNNHLIGLINIDDLPFERLTKYFTYDNGNFSISDELLNFYKKYKGIYFSCLMTDLDPKNVGLGKYIIYSSQVYARDVLKKDYVVAEINIYNRASYRLFTSFFTFGCCNKIIPFSSLDAKKIEIPVFYITSILNSELSIKFKESVFNNKIQKFSYSNNCNIDDMIRNRETDQILQPDELLMFDLSLVFKIKINLDILKNINY